MTAPNPLAEPCPNCGGLFVDASTRTTTIKLERISVRTGAAKGKLSEHVDQEIRRSLGRCSSCDLPRPNPAYDGKGKA